MCTGALLWEIRHNSGMWLPCLLPQDSVGSWVVRQREDSVFFEVDERKDRVFFEAGRRGKEGEAEAL